MRAVIVKSLADLRRRRLQAAVIFVTVLFAMAAGTTALTLTSQTRDPYQIAFDKQKGAHLQVAFNAATDQKLLGNTPHSSAPRHSAVPILPATFSFGLATGSTLSTRSVATTRAAPSKSSASHRAGGLYPTTRSC